MNARGPRLLIPSGLLGITLATLAVLAGNTARYPAGARAVLVAALAVVVADGAIAWRALRRLDADMLTPAAATTGTAFSARATVRGVTRPATVDPLVADARPTPFDGPEPFALECHPTTRGVYNHLLVEVRCRSPLGLWAAARRIAVLLARPLAVGPVPVAGPDPPRGPDGGGDAPGPRDDLTRSTRPYQAGDSARLVHWPATAHEGRLMVRETDAGRDPRPVVAVDLRGPGPAAEEALGRAAAVAATMLARSGAVRLVTAEAADGPETPLPRAVLLPATALRTRAAPPTATRAVDRVETDAADVARRLASAATAPLGDASLPPGAWRITEDGP